MDLSNSFNFTNFISIKNLKNLLQHPLVSGTAILFIGSNFANIFNFLFNFYVGRNLSVVDYATFASLVSLIALPMYASGSVIPTIVNYAGRYLGKGEYGFARGLYVRVTKICLAAGSILFVASVIFSKPIGDFFHVSNPLYIILVGFIVFLSFAGTVNTAFLQAKLAFTFITFTNLLSAVIKLIVGVVLIMIGLNVTGGIVAYASAVVVLYLLGFYPLRFLFHKTVKSSHIGIGELFKYGFPSAIALICVTSFITSDIMLVKHFFNQQEAGLYAGLSLVGRIIYFFSAPIGTVMFPLIVQKHAKKENYTSIFLLAVFLVFLSSSAITIFYFLFPKFSLVFILKHTEYAKDAQYLGLFSIFITLYSIFYLLVTYFLAINRTKVFIPILIGALLQIGGIWFFHGSFVQIISISLSIMLLLDFILFVYYFRTK